MVTDRDVEGDTGGKTVGRKVRLKKHFVIRVIVMEKKLNDDKSKSS